MVNRGRSERLGIISVNEIELINRADNRENLVKERNLLLIKNHRTDEEERRLKTINKELREISTRLSKFVKDLYERIIANELDWRIILKSKSLRSLTAISLKHFVQFPAPYQGDFNNYGIYQSLTEFFDPKFEEFDGTEKVPNFSTWKIQYQFDPKRKERLYWLDTTIEPVPTIEDVFIPEYAIKGIKGVWNKKKGNVIEKFDVRAILKESLDLEKRFQSRIKKEELPRILPRIKEDAIDIFAIKDRILKFHEKKQAIDSIVPMVEDHHVSDYARAAQEQYVTKGSEDMVKAYSEVEPYILKIQKILKKYGLKMEPGWSSL